ncbi:MAG: A24 family peptidase [Candidatus Sumerlaeia bacterium]
MWWIIVATSLVAAVFDIRQRRIPNFLTLPVLVAGLAWNGYRGGLDALGWALWVAIVLALPYLVLFAAGMGGAGDAKLMGALGAWLGAPYGFYLLGGVAASGAVLGLAYALLRRRAAQTWRNLAGMTMFLPWIALGPGSLRERASVLPTAQVMTRMPYAVAVFVGSCVTAGGVWLWNI